MNDQKTREEFEVHCRREGLVIPFSRHALSSGLGDRYIYSDTQSRWVLWQESTKGVEITDQKVREEFDAWCAIKPISLWGESAWDAWQAACANKQKEIESLQAQLREQHQNQLDLMEKIDKVYEKTIAKYEKPKGVK